MKETETQKAIEAEAEKFEETGEATHNRDGIIYAYIAGRSKSLEEKDKAYNRLYEDFQTLCRTNEIYREENKRYRDECNSLNTANEDYEKQLDDSLLLYQNMVNTISENDKEIERLKALLKNQFLTYNKSVMYENQAQKLWQQFKIENNL